MLTIKVTFGTVSPMTFNKVTFFQYHDGKLIIIEQGGKNECQFSINDIVSVELTKES